MTEEQKDWYADEVSQESGWLFNNTLVIDPSTNEPGDVPADMSNILVVGRDLRRNNLVQSQVFYNGLMIGSGTVSDGSLLSMSMDQGLKSLAAVDSKIRQIRTGIDNGTIDPEVGARNIAALQQERDTLQTFNGMPDSQAARQTQIDHINTLYPAAIQISNAWLEPASGGYGL